MSVDIEKSKDDLVYLQSLLTDSGYNLDGILEILASNGAQEVGLGFNLFTNRTSEGLDILFRSHRLLIYLTNKNDMDFQRSCQQKNIPRLPIHSTTIKGNIVASSIPYQTTRLDTQTFEDREFTDGSYTGAMEIMLEMGRYYGQIYTTLGLFPARCCLSDLALVNGEKRFLRAIPPIELTTSKLDIVSELLLEELNNIDPENVHKEQMKAFNTGFNKEIK